MRGDIEAFLSSLNLSEKEIELYLASLKAGPQTASTLAKRTGMARSTINFLFEELIQKGFASKSIQAKYTYYTVIEPDNIEYILQDKNAEIKKQMNIFRDILPILNGIHQTNSPLPKIQYFEGVEALCRLIDDCCKKDETVLFISEHNKMHPKIREYLNKVYLPVSRKHQNKNEMIVCDGVSSRNYAKIASEVYDEIIFVDPKLYKFTLTMAVYGNKVALCSYNPNDLSGIIIENPLIAAQMKIMFEIVKGNFLRK